MTENPFDPNYKFPPMPVPPPEHFLARIERAAALASWKCPHCNATVTAIGADSDGLLQATEERHEPDCPDYVAD
ncbi:MULTISPECIES: hypothetical protein [unclassified Cryobacterium]|uniref:hypothetical protein n=1 Tax=unclassified Cryobacterium TaxID=2649013 RepID=UPI001069967F|nr:MULTISPECIES: hypothetical protein [unclassified Cryobacterium]TFC00255.1 hypothetical protein E3O39_01720 [Cryobacterium sp. MDB2-A-1]TFC14119.1 hypothetical protein E3O35_03990 [Cryobacterium sp. MDB2-A-2]